MPSPGYSSSFTQSEIWDISKDKLEGEQFMEAAGQWAEHWKVQKTQMGIEGSKVWRGQENRIFNTSLV